jgi:hypothetical protein
MALRYRVRRTGGREYGVLLPRFMYLRILFAYIVRDFSATMQSQRLKAVLRSLEIRCLLFLRPIGRRRAEVRNT